MEDSLWHDFTKLQNNCQYVIFKVCYFAGGVPGTLRPNCLVSCLKEIIAFIASDGT